MTKMSALLSLNDALEVINRQLYKKNYKRHIDWKGKLSYLYLQMILFSI